MDKRFVLFLFLAVLVFAILASNVWSKDLAVGQSVSVSLSEADMAVLRAYAAEQLERSDAEITESAIGAEALRLAQAFAERGVRDVVAAQRRRLAERISVDELALIAEAEAVVDRKISLSSARESEE